MDSIELWQTLAFAFIVFAFFVYSVLDGFDLGTGVFLPFVAKTEEEKTSMFNAIAPFWDGNEVWLVIGSASLFAAFPNAYAKLLPAFYIPFLFVILCFMCRIISLELSYSSGRISKLFLGIFSVSSFLASLSGLLAVGFIVSGIEVDQTAGSFALTPACFFKPLPYLLAATLLSLILLHTVSFLVWKVDGALKERLTALAKKIWLVFGPLFIGSVIALGFSEPNIWSKPLIWLGAAIVAGAALAYRAMLRPGKEKHLFLISALGIGGIWIVVAGAMFPNIINPLGGGVSPVTVHNSSSPLNTLHFTVVFALIGAAVIIAYTAFVYKVLGKKRKDSAAH